MEYLVEKANSDEDLKEFTIGSELYGINYAEDKSNGTVRSYFYKLRKRLEQYYADDAIKHEIIFEIKKGQYNLSFSTPKNFYNQKEPNNNYLKVRYKTLGYSFAGICLALIAYFAFNHFYSKPMPLWESFFSKDASNIIVISDQYIITEQLEDGKYHAVFYEDINNHSDFLDYVKKHPESRVQAVDYTAMSKMAPYSISFLSAWFSENKASYTIEMESKLTASEATNNNILFIGQFKTMNISKSLFLKNSQVFSTYHDGFKYADKDTTVVYDTKHGKTERVEYAMVSSTTNNQGKQSLYFVSNNDIGVMATVNKFTDSKWLKEFYKQIPNKSPYFNALFKVEGLERTDISCELVQLEVLE
ncbi:hypothetical protein Q4566_09605 [Tamlana sp. 2_MG-2023]|uniref:hypothetical protein n=1 Tax=unclassified Tamlana TaxID=2614803 RepID=UPI0026E216BE|nr:MULTISPECIES: hypothetical protein [unclassified Tamlana]MDO6760451.1 hypothetical protein [Tamlana sp. 2_MG-2023]MDO6790707.1 hypothetical protein [Tamlana sp. 1_MG-2023]